MKVKWIRTVVLLALLMVPVPLALGSVQGQGEKHLSVESAYAATDPNAKELTDAVRAELLINHFQMRLEDVHFEEDWAWAMVFVYDPMDSRSIHNRSFNILARRISGGWVIAFPGDPVLNEWIRDVPSGLLSSDERDSLAGRVASLTASVGHYKLPYPAGLRYRVTSDWDDCRGWDGQGNCIAYHRAIDFGMNEGHTVVAAMTGQVVDMRSDSTVCCGDSSCGGDANFITLYHSNVGEYTHYVHFTPNSIPADIHVGKTVEQGKKVGGAGHSGWTWPACAGNHLHFAVTDGSGSRRNPYFIEKPGTVWYGDYVFSQNTFNQPPKADAGGPYKANEGETVILNASGSSDPDGTIVSYKWDLDGDGEYDDATGQTPSWTWGNNYAGNIGLKVTDDNGATDTDTTTVTISNVAPTVDAGPDQTVFRYDVVALSGAWADPAGSLDEPYSWEWDVTGDGITDNSGSASYGSVVPASTSFATEGIYTLTFAVTDKDSGVGSDSIVVEVLNRPPDCSAAAPSIETLWPPNHKFVLVNVLGVTDPEGDSVSITIDSIGQDEPVDTVGDGRFSPDGQGIGTDTAHVRAECVGTKKAPGNGRVYHIGFTADDGHGGSCSSEVLVGVPHDQRDTPPVNDGVLYDSTAMAP